MKSHESSPEPSERTTTTPVSVDAMREAQPAQKLPKPPKPRKTERRRRGRKS